MRSTHLRSRWTGLVGALCRLFPMNSHATVPRLFGGPRCGRLGCRGTGRTRQRTLVSDGVGYVYCERIATRFGGRTRPRQTDVAQFIRGDPGFARACGKHELRVANGLSPPSLMCPMPVAKAWPAPSVRTAGQLAEWLGITANELDWFADLRRLEFKRNQGRLRHYRDARQEIAATADLPWTPS